MLKHPFLNIPYAPKLRHFLGPFDIYDREETLGKELAYYDVNIDIDRTQLIKKYIIEKFSDLSYRHRKILCDTLEAALSDKTYDFSQLFRQAPGYYCNLPWGWSEMDNPRGFFEEIYRLTNEWWKEDLQKASLEDPATW
ncbi:hypothetical protein [Pseudomonas sp. rhizo25]|uniref:hypothetical protein n=1 Tax=Pseudomonas sp. rhizo25 TaxID=3059675 RepID=UPI00288F3276|nr:hypothetical protein [Pseudomonas sp. rhizo25]MDT3231006.1 hypothetical protein [Pseudomonas sp. rhizo25]